MRLSQTAAAAPGFGIAHRPPATDGWIELVSLGLTFDCTGLAPGAAAAVPHPAQRFGFDPGFADTGLQAIELQPGPHLADAANLMPLVRGAIGLGAQLALLDGVQAVCWQPAGSWMEPGYFRRIVSEWLRGGAFPALGLTTLDRRADGTLASRGLAFLIGQELLLAPPPGASAGDAARLAVRLIDELVYSGPLRERAQYSGPHGEELVAQPNEQGDWVRVDWR